MSRNKQNKPVAVVDDGPSAEQIQAALEQAAQQDGSDEPIADEQGQEWVEAEIDLKQVAEGINEQTVKGAVEEITKAVRGQVLEQFDRGQTPVVQHMDEGGLAPALEDPPVDLTALQEGTVPQPPVWAGETSVDAPVEESTLDPVQEPEVSEGPEVHPAFANKWEALCTSESLPLYRQLSERYKMVANRALQFIEVMQIDAKKILVTHDKGIEMTIDFYRSLVRGINRAGNERRAYLEFICACIRPYRGDNEIFGIKQAHAWFDFLVTVPRVEVESWSKLIELLRVGCDPRGRKIATRGMDLVSYVQGFTGPGLVDGDSAQFIVHFMTE